MIEVNGKRKSYRELRAEYCDNIQDEMMFIARASEGAVSVDWLSTQPIATRRRYVESYKKELEERERKLNQNK